jgi:hypothetical protein
MMAGNNGNAGAIFKVIGEFKVAGAQEIPLPPFGPAACPYRNRDRPQKQGWI